MQFFDKKWSASGNLKKETKERKEKVFDFILTRISIESIRQEGRTRRWWFAVVVISKYKGFMLLHLLVKGESRGDASDAMRRMRSDFVSTFFLFLYFLCLDES